MCGLFDQGQQERKRGYLEDWRARKTLITPLFGFIFLFLQKYPLGFVLAWAENHCKCLKEHSVVEIYVLGFFISEIVIFLIVWQFAPPFSLWAAILVTIFMGMRLVDIAQSWVNILLVQPTGEVLYASRLLILTLINYIELILSFSVVNYLWNNTFNPEIAGLRESTLFTLGTMTAIGSKYEPVSLGAWAVYVFEIGFGLFFLIIIIVRALTYFESKRHGE
jgi:hypothetical protein